MNESKEPLFSVVMPTYNHAHFLYRSINSVLEQTYSNLELIVIDNHSTDNTENLVRMFTDSRLHYSKINNEGIIARSRNHGIKKANGEWIAFLDSDDWWEKNKLEACTRQIQKDNQKIDFLYHDLEITQETPNTIFKRTLKGQILTAPVLNNLLIKGNVIANSSAVVRKTLFYQIGFICEKEELVASEDYHTWLKIAQITNNFVYLPHILGHYMTHNKGVSKKDMSLSGWEAIGEFLDILQVKEKLKAKANLKYTSGRFNYLSGNITKAIKDLHFVVKHGSTSIKLKSCFMILASLAKRLPNKIQPK